MFGAWAALVGLAGARVRRRAGALLAVALGVAAAAAAVLAASPLSLVSGQSAMERSLRSVAPAERAVRVTVVRDAGGPASLDSTVRDALRGPVFAPGQARAVRFGGRSADRLRALHRAAGFPDGTLGSVVLTGVDAPERWISLSSGRLPRSCVPAACEVVAVGGGRRLPRAFALQGMHMRVVGRGRLDGVPLGAVPPGPGSVDSAASFVVASGVEDLSALRPLRSVVRTFAWARVLDPAAVHPWTAGRLLDELLDTRTQLLSSLSSAEVRGPSERIAAEQARGRAAGAFSLVIAGLAATVLLAFAAFAAAEQHAGVALELGRLRAMAARRRHLVALVLAEAAVPALFGVLLGFGLAACAGLVAAGWAGVPAGPVLREGLFSSGQITAAVVLWAAAVVVVAGVLGGAQSRGIRIALEAGCAVVIGALLWQAASRGRVDAAELARDGTADPVLLLAPGAVALACGLIALRVVPALLRALARFAGRPPTRLRRAPTRVPRARSIGAYLTLVFLARAPGRTAAAVAVVAVAAAAATFALGHARALQRGELDQAAYRTAGDVRTLAAVPGAPDARGTPVIPAQAETLATSTPVQLLGVGAEALPRLPGWRADFSPVPLSTLARRLDGDPGGVRMRGIEIPRTAISARRLFVVHHGATGNVVSLQGASLEVAEGEMVAVMGPSGSGKSTLLACLSGLQAVTAGELHVFGARLDAASARALAKHRARTVAVVSQDAGRALGDDQPVGARIALRARLAGMGSRNAKHRAAELLERVGLEGREGAPNRAQRRRAAAGRAVRRDRGAAEAAAG